MNIVITGGTGFIGRAVAQAFARDGHHATVLTRTPREAAPLLPHGTHVTGWDARSRGGWERPLGNADAVINLAGAPIADGRWTEQRKALLCESRVGVTRLLVAAISDSPRRPAVLINASGIGIYGDQGETLLDESSAPGMGFLSDLTSKWEAEARLAEETGARVVLLRLGMVLGRDGGALPRMVTPFKAFIGGPIAPGRQWVSWIHLHDVIDLIRHALIYEDMAGAINAVAPTPVTMHEFCRTLGSVLRRPSWMPVPATALRIMLGELSSMLTTGQRVTPLLATRSGYAFHFPTLRPALESIFQKPGMPGSTA